jgi:hypothetical protein
MTTTTSEILWAPDASMGVQGRNILLSHSSTKYIVTKEHRS